MIYTFFKRFFDIVLSCLALIITSPIFLILYFFSRFGKNSGPLFFKQLRVGRDHNNFYIYKFRSMIVNADQVLAANPELYNKYVKNNYKLTPEEDPRITKLGVWLRKTSIDEIPQFINIIKGEMALVGPRPVVMEELYEYGENIDKFLSVRPGAMGYWQASGRSNIGYPERADIELYYVDHVSFLFDVKIIFKNLLSIIKSDGAY
ncbi:sugar transferase [Paucilactobacillus nenjiangensis]|uniref:sugar transferase n=1 Tax=Paucilactobacillus nenjiangensis TaxID=1296540 RepID=UPI0010F5B24A|nr:sugar transferase [Paucilactobacillus nenjiangensis]